MHIPDFFLLVMHLEIVPSFQFSHDVFKTVTFKVEFPVKP